MKKWIIGIVGASAMSLSLAACDNMTSQQRTVVGAAGGAAAGLVAADALKANSNWKVISALGGAAAGTMVAQNNQRKVCAYARGDGTYYEAPCP